MRAVVLVGGEGTRLRPLTLTTPKPLLPIAGVPLIERVVRNLARHGVDEVILSMGYKADAFRAAFPSDECAGVPMRYVVEAEPLDTGGAIAYAISEAGVAERFVAVNVDILTEMDVGDLIAFHHRAGGLGTIALTPVDDPSRFGVVATDEHGRVTAFVEKPSPAEAVTNLINAGTYVLEPAALAGVAVGERASIERVVFPDLVQRGELYAQASDAYWIDVGTPESYVQANVDIAGGAAVDGSADVDATAVVIDSVILAGARVGRGARIEHSIVGAGAEIGEGAVLADYCVIAPGASVAAGESLHGIKVNA